MINFKELLEANPSGVLATQNGDRVKTRVFQYLFTEEHKVFFCTSNQKPVYNQLKDNPYVSFCTYSSNFSQVVSVNGKTVFLDDKVLKVRALDENPGIKDIYKDAENPEFELFYIDIEEVETFSYTEGAKTYTI